MSNRRMKLILSGLKAVGKEEKELEKILWEELDWTQPICEQLEKREKTHEAKELKTRIQKIWEETMKHIQAELDKKEIIPEYFTENDETDF